MNDKITQLAEQYAQALAGLKPYGALDGRLSVPDYRRFTSAEVNVRLVAGALVENRFPMTLDLLEPRGGGSNLQVDTRQQLEKLYVNTLTHGIEVVGEVVDLLKRS
jgi:hypothetical protein